MFYIPRSGIAGATDFTGADMPELRRHLNKWIVETEETIRENERLSGDFQRLPPPPLPPKIGRAVAAFIEYASDRFIRYARELHRVHNETAASILPQHIDILTHVCEDARRFDRACIRFKNEVLEGPLSEARKIVDKIYVNARSIPISYLDLGNLVTQLRTFVGTYSLPRHQSAANTNPRYLLIEKLGKGAVADVWRAEDSLLKRIVAIKLVRRSAPSNEDATAHARAMAQVPPHANIVAIYDVVDLQEPLTGEPARGIVMELVDGAELQEFLRSAPANGALARSLGISLLNAIQHYHNNDLVHYDLHAGNVRVTKDGTIKVYDPSCHASGALQSTATRAQMMQRDVKDVRDLLRTLLDHAQFDLNAVIGFDRATMTMNELENLRSAFIAATNTSVPRNNETPPPSIEQRSGPRRVEPLAVMFGTCDVRRANCTAIDSLGEVFAIDGPDIGAGHRQVNICPACLDEVRVELEAAD